MRERCFRVHRTELLKNGEIIPEAAVSECSISPLSVILR